MLDISAVDFKKIPEHKSIDHIYCINEDMIYRTSDILEATEPGCNIVSLDYVKELLLKWKMCRLFKTHDIYSFLESWNNRHLPIYSDITDFLLIKGKVSNIEKLYSKLEQEMPEVMKINNDIDKFKRLWSEKSILELKEIAKSSIFVSDIDLSYYFSKQEIVKFDKNTFYYLWEDFVNKEEVYVDICRMLQIDISKKNFKLIDSFLDNDGKVIQRNVLKSFCRLMQMKLLEEMK